MPGGGRKNAALVATTVTVPIMVVVLIVSSHVVAGSRHGANTDASLPALRAMAPSEASAHVAECTKLLQALPISLAELVPRVVHADSPFVVAWGQPAVIVSCGVRKPADLHPGSAAELRIVNDIPFSLKLTSKDAIYTDVDRGPYISATFQAGRQPANYLTLITSAIARSLPAVCTTDPAASTATQCAER